MKPAEVLLLVVGLLLVAEAFFLIRSRPVVGLWLLMAVALLGYAGFDFELQVLSYQIYATDITAVVLAAGAIEKRLGDELRRPGFGIVIALFVVALGRGFAAFGAETTVNSSRAILFLIVAIGFASTCDITLDEATKVWVAGSLVVSAQAVVFWLDNGLGTYARDGSRAVFWAEALIVSQTAILLLSRRERSASQLGAVFLLVVVLSQQRTVWAATIIAVLIGLFNENRQLSIGSLNAFKTRVLALGVVVVALVVIGPGDARQSFSYATSSISTESGTFGWRIEGWIEIIESFARSTLANQLIGQPMGTGFERRISFGLVNVSPHNMYIKILLSFGLIGAIAFFALIATAIKRALSHHSILSAIVGGLLVLSIGYEIPLTSGILIGIALTSRSTSESPGGTHPAPGSREKGMSEPSPSAGPPQAPRAS